VAARVNLRLVGAIGATVVLSDMATVHLIDDDAALRATLARLLGAAGLVVHGYATADDYLDIDPDDEPGCLVIDMHLPGIDGLQLQAALRHRPDHERPIIFISDNPDVRSSVQALRAGAFELLTKPLDGDMLLAAVNEAVTRDATLRERRARARRARADLESLRARERKVLDGILDGRLHKQLAAEIGVSERTIKVDRARVMERLGVRNLAALVKLLIEANEAQPSVDCRPSRLPSTQGLRDVPRHHGWPVQ
jgi:FixJ family two-component response regulator